MDTKNINKTNIDKTNIDNLLELLLTCNSNAFSKFSEENPITNETCVTFINAEGYELSIFFNIENFNNNLTYRINHYYEMQCLGMFDDRSTERPTTTLVSDKLPEQPSPEDESTNDVDENNNIVETVVNLPKDCLKFGSLSELSEVKSFLENFKKELRGLHPEIVLCEKDKSILAKYLVHICVAGTGIGLSCIGVYWSCLI